MQQIWKRKAQIMTALAGCATLAVLFLDTARAQNDSTVQGSVVSLAWDLNNDGNFSDATQLVSLLPSGQAIGDPFSCTAPIPECAAGMRNGHGLAARTSRIDKATPVLYLRLHHATSGDSIYVITIAAQVVDLNQPVLGTARIERYATAQALRSGQPPQSTRIAGLFVVWCLSCGESA